ncbi:TPA: phage tail protein, partial [Haemophilus influenzae]
MKSLMPQIDSNDGLFHNGNPATGEQGTRVTDTWLNNLQDRVRDVQAEAHYVLQKAGFTPKAETQTQLYQAIVKIIDDNRKSASTTQKGEVRLSSSTNSNSETQAATSKAVKTAYDKAVDAKTSVDRLQLNVSQNYIPNNKKSSAVNSSSSDTVATSAAVKTAYDKAVDAKTTAERKVGLRGNESIQGTKSFESKIIGFRGIGLADSQTYANANHLLNMGANDGDGWIEYKKSNRAIGTIRIRANGELSYNNQKIYHA